MKIIKKTAAAVLCLSMLAATASSFATVASAYSQVFEAENGILGGKAAISETKDAVDAKGGFSADVDIVLFKLNIDAAGRYDVTLTSKDFYNDSERKNAVFVNGEFWSYFYSGSDEMADDVVEGVYLKKGANTISVRKSDTCEGNFTIDKIKVATSAKTADVYNVDPILSNENSNDQTKRLMQYICDMYGKQTISGQFCSSGKGREITAIFNATGKKPAILGFDFMNYCGSYAEEHPEEAQKLKVTDSIIDWAKNYKGIPTITWHWLAPTQYIKGNTSTAYNAESTSIDIAKIMSGKDKTGYELLIKDIDRIAAQLKILQDNNISVLWRPLHEAGGNDTAEGWFWWGTDRDAYIQLWKLVYDRLTDYHKLNNLIWVWNGQKADWYPGDEYCDIVAWDIYANPQVYQGNTAKFYQSADYSKMRKIVTLSENGTVPSIDKMVEYNSMWSWFATWNGEFVIKTTGGLSEEYTTATELKKLYTSDKVITLDELPDLTTYPITYKQTTVLKRNNKHINPYDGTVTPPDTDTDTDTNTDTDKPTDTDTDTNTDTDSDNPNPNYYGTGDINFDGNVDILDVVLARSHVVGNGNLTDVEVGAGDVNFDGKLDILDIVFIRKVIVG